MASKLVVSRLRIRKQEHKVSRMNGSFIKEMWEKIPRVGRALREEYCPAALLSGLL